MWLNKNNENLNSFECFVSALMPGLLRLRWTNEREKELAFKKLLDYSCIYGVCVYGALLDWAGAEV